MTLNEAVETLVRVEPRFAQLADRHGVCQLIAKEEEPQDLFACLAGSIANQQLSGKAAATILKRFVDKYGLDPHVVADLTIEDIRATGFSAPKASYLIDLAQKVRANELPTVQDLHEQPEDDIVAQLTKVKGIGRWTVEMLLMFRLGRLDVWPVDDLGIRAGYAKVFELEDRPKPKELMALGERFKPVRSVAAWYLWRSLEN